ncbi:MAG: type VI secretion system tube protein Hcp [Pseudomonadota bacterium]
MDLILLQPGNPEVFGGTNDWDNGGSLIDSVWRDTVIGLGQCLELVSAHQGIKQQINTDVSNSARTSGRPVITEFTLTKYVDQTSVKFYEYCLRAEPLGRGKDHPTKLYIARDSGNKAANIITISLRDAIISEIELQTNPNDMPTERFKLNFTEILWTYTAQKADKTTAGSVTTGWSIARNRPIGEFTS